VSDAANEILQTMRRTKYGWGMQDLHSLYLGFGFSCREGAKHRVYIHGEFPQLRATVARQNSLPPGYAQRAVKLVDELDRLMKEGPTR